jgi:hypothetical protein
VRLFIIYAYVQKAETDAQRLHAIDMENVINKNERSVRQIIAKKDSIIQVLKLKIDSLEKLTK